MRDEEQQRNFNVNFGERRTFITWRKIYAHAKWAEKGKEKKKRNRNKKEGRNRKKRKIQVPDRKSETTKEKTEIITDVIFLT